MFVFARLINQCRILSKHYFQVIYIRNAYNPYIKYISIVIKFVSLASIALFKAATQIEIFSKTYIYDRT